MKKILNFPEQILLSVYVANKVEECDYLVFNCQRLKGFFNCQSGTLRQSMEISL